MRDTSWTLPINPLGQPACGSNVTVQLPLMFRFIASGVISTSKLRLWVTVTPFAADSYPSLVT